MINIKYGNKAFRLEKPTRIYDFITQNSMNGFYAAKVNNRLRDLTFVIGNDCELELLDITDPQVSNIYMRTVKHIFLLAVKRLYPHASVRFVSSIARGEYCEIDSVVINTDTVKAITAEMKNIVAQNISINRVSLPIEKAKEVYRAQGYIDKCDMLEYRKEGNVNLQECGGLYDYFYGYTMPYTSMAEKFCLHLYYPGIIIQTPRYELGGELPPLETSKKYTEVLRDSYDWGRVCNVRYIADINKKADENGIQNLINMCEVRHSNHVYEIASSIKNNIDRIRMVLIAGPSSSGKTTLARKISTQLAVFGIGSVIISMDDYYKDRDAIPLDEDGNVDFEHINTLKIDDFNNDLFSIISSKEVLVPKYSFEAGKAVSYRPVKLEKDSVIIIEGIHGLNESVSFLVPRMNKYKVYISALQHLSIDTHTPISSSQCRQIRRIVRDYLFRATRAERTFDMWPSVRRGEFKWIYPYQEDADYIFDSSLTYEIGVLKKYALPMLSQISSDDKRYISANALTKFLKYFRDIDDSMVPSNSILREFIGGNAYE